MTNTVLILDLEVDYIEMSSDIYSVFFTSLSGDTASFRIQQNCLVIL
jgi:hypothetical protein